MSGNSIRVSMGGGARVGRSDAVLVIVHDQRLGTGRRYIVPPGSPSHRLGHVLVGKYLLESAALVIGEELRIVGHGHQARPINEVVGCQILAIGSLGQLRRRHPKVQLLPTELPPSRPAKPPQTGDVAEKSTFIQAADRFGHYPAPKTHPALQGTIG